MKESGVYFAVRILFRGYCCVGFPSSSLNSSANGRPKKMVLGSECSPSASSLCPASPPPPPAVGNGGTSDCPAVESDFPEWPEALFFSAPKAFPPLLFLFLNDRRFRPLLLTVSLRVAQRDRCVELIGVGSRPPSSSSIGLGGDMVRESRAEPDQPELCARMAKMAYVAA